MATVVSTTTVLFLICILLNISVTSCKTIGKRDTAKENPITHKDVDPEDNRVFKAILNEKLNALAVLKNNNDYTGLNDISKYDSIYKARYPRSSEHAQESGFNFGNTVLQEGETHYNDQRQHGAVTHRENQHIKLNNVQGNIQMGSKTTQVGNHYQSRPAEVNNNSSTYRKGDTEIYEPSSTRPLRQIPFVNAPGERKSFVSSDGLQSQAEPNENKNLEENGINFGEILTQTGNTYEVGPNDQNTYGGKLCRIYLELKQKNALGNQITPKAISINKTHHTRTSSMNNYISYTLRRGNKYICDKDTVITDDVISVIYELLTDQQKQELELDNVQGNVQFGFEAAQTDNTLPNNDKSHAHKKNSFSNYYLSLLPLIILIIQ